MQRSGGQVGPEPNAVGPPPVDRHRWATEEGNEPIHAHAKKGDGECKLRLNPELHDLEEAWAYGMSPRLRREIRQIVFDHFDLIVEEWNRRFGDRDHADN